ncbi:MAG: hypothetical protein M1823_001251 [Watsoniomyces obsoletus]|nr:MAG: hypothetical protein M1823_001251 [Watsoniomyces obsoletus]
MSTVDNATSEAADVPSNGNGNLKPPSAQPVRRPHLLSRNSADRVNGLAQKSASSNSPASPSSVRKNSWISGLTAKFTSVPSSSTTTTSQTAKPAPERPMPAPSTRRASLSHAIPPPIDDSAPYVPASPKSTPSFFQSALRRFQSAQIPAGRGVDKGGLCERRVMNVDVARERCRVQGLEQAKLRRVAFCVDVEIAGAPKYNDDAEGSKKRKKENKKSKEKGEGEALKHPERVKASKDRDGAGKSNGDSKDVTESQPDKLEQGTGEQPTSNGNGNGSSQTVDEGTSKPGEATTPPDERPNRPNDQPTTDPLRIYRRCCQLRETSPLKRVVEQVTSPQMTPPGTVNSLDLSDMLLPLADVVTLADWLAVVPVSELNLNHCGLGDEGVRVILGALLAAKANNHGPTSSSSKEGLPEEGKPTTSTTATTQGFIEKLNLKNNPKIGRDGWKHISLFLHLSHSIKSVDLSMCPFPRPLADTTKKDPAWDMATLLAEAIGERYAGPVLEELIMSACQLTTEDVTKLASGASKSGLRRLELADNPECRMTSEGASSLAGIENVVVALHTDDNNTEEEGDTESRPVTGIEVRGSVVDDEEGEDRTLHAKPSQHGSDVSMASRALAMEEGHLHRIGHQVRRSVFGSRSSSPARTSTGTAGSPSPRTSMSSPPPVPALPTSTEEEEASDTVSSGPTTTATATATATELGSAPEGTRINPEEEEQADAEKLAMLSKRLEDIGGEELRTRILKDGYELALMNLGMTLEDIQRLAMLDPESYSVLQQAQDMAVRNVELEFTPNREGDGTEEHGEETGTVVAKEVKGGSGLRSASVAGIGDEVTEKKVAVRSFSVT